MRRRMRFAFAAAAALVVSSCATVDDPARRTAFPVQAANAPPCSADTPVLMIVAGRTIDKARMAAYSQALTASGLYARTGGIYLNEPRPIQVFEGQPGPDDVALVIRFPSECAAVAFWYSDLYQNTIKPMRENPSAGDYSVILYRALD